MGRAPAPALPVDGKKTVDNFNIWVGFAALLLYVVSGSYASLVGVGVLVVALGWKAR